MRADELNEGLRTYERNLLSLIVEEISDGGYAEINETGTKIKYKPGVLICGKHAFDCGVERSIPLILLGITNDSKDPTVDTFQTTTLNIVKRFGIDSEVVDLKIVRRGAPPDGGGVVILKVPMVENILSVRMVKTIKGTTCSLACPSLFGNGFWLVSMCSIKLSIHYIRLQGLLFLLCALCPQEYSKVRVGKLSPHAIETLGHIRDFLETVILKCVGCGLKNLLRKLSWKDVTSGFLNT
ncbi:hypothetical protein MKW92_041265 [Papaver armeniacum]|nr:hypothetical protein MKW92_041265 [Papaver armeniacum]